MNKVKDNGNEKYGKRKIFFIDFDYSEKRKNFVKYSLQFVCMVGCVVGTHKNEV